MENLKVDLCGLTNKEKQNAVWWLNELGFSTGFKSIGFYSYLYGCIGSQAPYDKTIQFGNSSKTFSRNTGKEITLPQLRDLVVLKRNDIEDANAFRHDNDVKYYITSDNKYYYFSNIPTFRWTESCNDIDYLEKHVKPIEKKEMKEPKQAEFLVKTDSGYVLQLLDENAGGEDVVRIPDGAEIAVKSNRGYIEFRKGASFYAEEWCEGSWHVNDFPKHDWDIVWKRETLNDQVASAEEARQSGVSDHDLIFGRGVLETVGIREDFLIGVGAASGSSQGQSDFPLNNYELNHRVAKAFNAVRGTNLNEDDVNYLRELINLTVSHYGV